MTDLPLGFAPTESLPEGLEELNLEVPNIEYIPSEEDYPEEYTEEYSENYFYNHAPSYFISTDEYLFARSLDPERFEEYELNNAIKHNMFCPDH